MQIRWKHRALALFIALFTLFYAYSAQAVTRHPLFISAESQKGDVDFSEIKQGVCKFSHLNGGKYRLIVLDYSNGFETQLVVSGDKGAKTIPIDVKITGTPKTTLKHHPNKKKVITFHSEFNSHTKVVTMPVPEDTLYDWSAVVSCCSIREERAMK